MQFHLNGFKPGAPHISHASIKAQQIQGPKRLPENVDVLIIGCGPAGLTLAAQLAAFEDITTCIVDQKSGPLKVGQADGIACRTMEMFEAFNFSEKVLKEAYWVNETIFWKPDEVDSQKITRSKRIQDTEDGLSEFPHVILNQARVHDFFLEAMQNAPRGLLPHYNRRLSNISEDTTAGTNADYPICATFENADSAMREQINARYVIGCDGARSVVRESLSLKLHGDSANQAWGVMDILVTTDFPDIRYKTVIQSATEGNLLIIPREGGYMVRLYIELDKLNENERISNRNLTANHLISAAQRIFYPYKLDVAEVAWWSVYEIGQRLCDKFDNVPIGHEKNQRPTCFIAGDACHTHSPKAGQGMNVSMRDSFNLGWKLAAVLSGQCAPDILHTYSSERQSVAKELIDFDREFAKMFSAPPKESHSQDTKAITPAEFQKYFQKHGRFTAGTAIQYTPSLITAMPKHQHLAGGFEIGMRFHSAPVIRFSDAKPMQLGHVVKADGRWRLFAFCNSDHPANTEASIHGLCHFLFNDPTSPILKYTPKANDIDTVFDFHAIFQQSHHDIDRSDLPADLFPQKGRYQLRDQEKVFCPDLKSKADIFHIRKIDRENGCLVVVRPDQHIANILPLTAYRELSQFFNRFMIDAN